MASAAQFCGEVHGPVWGRQVSPRPQGGGGARSHGLAEDGGEIVAEEVDDILVVSGEEAVCLLSVGRVL